MRRLMVRRTRACRCEEMMRTHRMRRFASNRLVLAGAVGALVWFADQPTVGGYNPLLEMFWDPGFLRLPARDGAVLLFSWLATTLFCHLVLFAVQRGRQRP